MKLNLLLLGSGGREHALAWKLAQSSLLDKLFTAPGNPGTMALGQNIQLNPNDFEAVGVFCLANNIGMVVVGPEEPLVNGIHDYFADNPLLSGIHVIGPKREGAKLEGSKDFAKGFMNKYGIPTAASQTFTADTIEEGYTFLKSMNAPYVLKADGLAAGKGVVICTSYDEAVSVLSDMLLKQKFGAASVKVVIEEYLTGIELSAFVLTDGDSYIILPEAKDYKKIGEGDTGPNTGGMGSISPVPFASGAFMQKTEERIIRRTVEGLKKEGIPYSGFIFFGLINVNGDPYVIEYNCRMGDPETESVIPRIQGDLLELFVHLAEGTLSQAQISFDEGTFATVVLVSGGYPEAYPKGKLISGLDQVTESILFHAGTRMESEFSIVTNGGRVLAVTSRGETLGKALDKCYKTASGIGFEGIYYRKDIGFDLH